MPIFPALGPAFAPASLTDRELPGTLLSLERFARIINYSPMLMHQVYVTELQDASSCSDPILQYSWQPRGGGQPGRAEITHAIKQAEDAIEREAHFSVRPRWHVDDVTFTSSVPSRVGTWGASYRLGVKAPSGYVIQGGREAWSLVESNSPITYNDRDGDGYKEYATVVVNTTVTDANELELYYPSTVHGPGWEIRPLTVVLSGGIATINFSRHLAVRQELLERLDAQGVDGAVDSNFLSAVDVWRHYNDPSQMGIAEWEPSGCEVGASGDITDVAAQAGYITPVDARNGLLHMHAGTWDVATAAWQRACPSWWEQPLRVRLWYRAGYRDARLPRPMQEMASNLERAVSYLALAYMDREWATCEQLRNVMQTWRADMAKAEAGGDRYQLSARHLENPFGTTRAAMYAWEVVKRLQVGEAVLSS